MIHDMAQEYFNRVPKSDLAVVVVYRLAESAQDGKAQGTILATSQKMFMKTCKTKIVWCQCTQVIKIEEKYLKACC